MFRSQSSDHHQGSITVLVQLSLIGVHASSYSGMWLYVVCVSVHTMYLSVWCLVMYHVHNVGACTPYKFVPCYPTLTYSMEQSPS